MMHFAFHFVPLTESGAAQDELNRFLSTHRVVAVSKHLVQESAVGWAFCVEWLPPTEGASPSGEGRARRATVDYKEVLSPEHFAVFARLREVRKALATRESVPPYAVFTNEQLAAMVTGGVQTLAALQAIEGVGPGKCERYGAAVLAVLTEASDAARPAAD